MWHDDEDPEKGFAAPLAYADALRIRPPGVPFFGLGPHIDAGSLCRWAEPEYRKVYEKIWSGKAEEYDPYDLTHRKLADPNHYPGDAQSQMCRAFQGWTALTRAGANEGSLLVYPDVKTSIAYVLLRPFFKPPENEDDVLDPEKWSLNLDDPWFPGVWRHTVQELSPAAFPHLRLKDCLVSIPTMNPGDTMWWHCDVSQTSPLVFGPILIPCRCAMLLKSSTRVKVSRALSMLRQLQPQRSTPAIWKDKAKTSWLGFHRKTSEEDVMRRR